MYDTICLLLRVQSYEWIFQFDRLKRREINSISQMTNNHSVIRYVRNAFMQLESTTTFIQCMYCLVDIYITVEQ